MVPRFKPYLGRGEFSTLLQHQSEAVNEFEAEFSHTFEAQQAIAFPYGRSALWAFYKALGLENVEIIIPAYTCSVVAHAVVLSGNIPHFVDITLYDYNMDLNQVEAAINERTRAIVATHLFGYPLNVDRLNEIIRAAEARFGHKIWVIQDCAHAFGARWQEKLVCNEGDVALFGLNISKTITSIFGGMLTTNNSTLADRLRSWRDKHFHRTDLLKALRRRLYLMAVYLAFNGQVYGFVNWLQEETPLLNRLTKAYHLDEKIHFPPDYVDKMLAVEAQVGLVQLRKYSEIVERQRENAYYYNENLPHVPDWVLPPLIEGAIYSHYVLRVPDRMGILKHLQTKGVQLGQLIEYSIPHLREYRQYATTQEFPNAQLCSHHTVNLPIYTELSSNQRQLIIDSIRTV